MQANTLPKNERKVGIITGASSGIGYGLALKLSERFDHLYITSRRISELEKLNDEIKIPVYQRILFAQTV